MLSTRLVRFYENLQTDNLPYNQSSIYYKGYRFKKKRLKTPTSVSDCPSLLAVHDPVAMRLRHQARGGEESLQALGAGAGGEVERAGVVDEVHRQVERDPVIEGAPVDRAHEPGQATQPVSDQGFAREAPLELVVRGARGGRDLERDPLVELGVEGDVDRAHAAAPELSLNAISIGDQDVRAQLTRATIIGRRRGRPSALLESNP